MKVLRGLRVVTDVDFLHRKSCLIDKEDKEIREELKSSLIKMYEVYDGKMQGLAAIQCGLAYCAILLRFKKGDEPVVVYNPKVILKLGFEMSNEGCMSEGDERFWVRRPTLCLVSYYDENFKKHYNFYGFKKGRIFCHEVDHLHGILLQDKGKPVKEN